MAAEAIVSGIYDVRLENDVLKLSEHRYYVKDKKLHYEYEGKSFDVDAKTMRRSDSSDTFPRFVSIEK